MSLSRQIFICLFINFSFVRSSSVISNKFNITLKTPGNASSPTALPHKSVHVKYNFPNDMDQWTIVGFEPLIQTHQRAVEELTVHLCDLSIGQSIWYDDRTICNDDQSMLIYEWTPYSSPTPFRISDDSGFVVTNSKSIVLTVVYKKEKKIHKEQSGITLLISTLPPKFRLGTLLVGDKQKGTQFSCRSSNHPRLIYGVKKLNTNKNSISWRISIIRVREFGRKIVQSVFDFKPKSNISKNDVEITTPDLFLMNGDYLLIECDHDSQNNCYFIIYYMYKSNSIVNDHICQHNEYPKQFKLLPSKQSLNKTNSWNISGSTIFLIICILLFLIWISTIIGCIIMRRIRGLKNFRPEPTFSSPLKKNKSSARGVRQAGDHGHQRGGDDHVLQTDGEHAG